MSALSSFKALSRIMLVALVLLAARPALAEDAYIVVDAGTGKVLNAMNPDQRLYPASMTKIMTLFMTFEALSQGRLSLRTQLPVSELAATQAPSKLGLRAGSTIDVQDCILAAVTLSANDCAMVLAEGIGGSEAQFAQLMTDRAHSLGMVNTHYNNPNGLPDEGQLTSARDMATLAAALIHRFPKYYPVFATREFTYHGISHANHNHLMSRYPGMDGIKTGFIRASGFNLTASAVQHGHRLIAVVFGGSSAYSRDNYMAGLLNDGFRRMALEPAPVTPEAPPPVPPAAPAEAGAVADAGARGEGEIAGVRLAEAGDPVEPNESTSQVAGNPPGAPIVGQTIAVTPLPQGQAEPLQPEPPQAAPVQQASAADPIGDAIEPSKAYPAPATPPQATPSDTGEGDMDVPEPKHVLRLPTTRMAVRAPVVAKGGWHVQLSTYTSKAVADTMLKQAVKSLPVDIRGRAQPQAEIIHIRGQTVYRAELTGFDQQAAKKACGVLAHCVPVKS